MDQKPVTRTRTDADRIQHLADADSQGETVILETDADSGMLGEVVTTSQTRVLDEDISVADGMRDGVTGVKPKPGEEW